MNSYLENLYTCLLADVFQSFRKTILKEYKLDPCHFLSIPGLAWTAALRETGARLELLNDSDKYQFFELGIRGGMCGVNKRLCTANNPQSKNYDVSKDKTYLTYLDFNNLYGWAMN